MLDFMIIGAQKAATTTVHQALRSLPAVAMPKGESPMFEDPDFATQPWVELGRIREHDNQLVGIKRPDCLCSSLLIERIAASHKNLKFIVILREPIARAVSAYYHLMRHGHLPVLPLNVGIRRCIEHYEQQLPGRAKSVIEFGLYGQYLSVWFNHFSRNNFLILGDDAVKNDVSIVIKKCCEHLGIPFEHILPEVAKPKNVGLYAPYLVRISQVGHFLRTEQIPETDRRQKISGITFARVAGDAIVGIADTLSMILPNKPDDLDTETKRVLNSIYLKDRLVLSKLVDNSALYWVN